VRDILERAERDPIDCGVRMPLLLLVPVESIRIVCDDSRSVAGPASFFFF